MTNSVNDNLILVSGESTTGKSMSLINLRDQEGVMYLNCEAGKKLPFKNKFKSFIITDPLQVFEAFDHANGNSKYHTVVIDTLTFLMDMYESQYVLGSSNTMQGWANYQQYFKELMQIKVASIDKNVIVMAHTRADLDEKAGEYKINVPIKGSLKNNGVESYFSTVVSTKKVSLKELENYQNNLLHITEEDELLGYKHVFQTRLTKKTTGERIRSPMRMFSLKETYIDNDCQLLLDHLKAYYEE